MFAALPRAWNGVHIWLRLSPQQLRPHVPSPFCKQCDKESVEEHLTFFVASLPPAILSSLQSSHWQWPTASRCEGSAAQQPGLPRTWPTLQAVCPGLQAQHLIARQGSGDLWA